MIKSFLLFLILCSFFGQLSYAQGIPIGAWRHHLPTNRVMKVVDTKENIIGATNYGLVMYNRADNSLSLFNKVHGLSDFGISSLEYIEEFDVVFVGYNNGNIDIIKNCNTYNIPDIRQTTTILGSKRINHALEHDGYIYISTDFGIVQLNPQSLVITNTYLIGDEASILKVNHLMVFDDYYYASTEDGMLTAYINAPNLADFNSWVPLEDEPVPGGKYLKAFTAFDMLFLWNRSGDIDQVFYLKDDIWNLFLQPEVSGRNNSLSPKNGIGYSNEKLWVAHDGSLDIFDSELELIESIHEYHYGSVNPIYAFYDDQATLWIADNGMGIVRQNPNGEFQNYIPEAPAVSSSSGLGSAPGIIWVAPGAISSGGVNTWNYSGVLFFENERWRRASRFNIEGLVSVFDIIRVTPDPGNTKQAYFSSWSRGLFRLTTDRDFTLYDETNSTLQLRAGINDYVRIGGSAFDNNRNLWVTNSEVEKPISVKLNNGSWMAFDTKGLVQDNQLVGQIVVDNFNQKWIVLPGNGILVFKENTLESNNDFNVRRLTTQAGNGSLPTNYVFSLAVDQNGYVWVGTQKGVVVFYTPQSVFTDSSIDAHQPIVVQDGFAGLLLENDQVNTITIDGGNNKWFGTSRSGAFFMTPDARNTYQHFTTENSPLPSNNIFDITIEPETGEVFFATDMGLASFRNFATAAGEKHEDVYAYPNPVRPGYDGYIAIKGLVRNAHIKITDVNGHLVYETRAQGGQAIWNGKDLNGNKPSSGVYTVFSTNSDGSETAITKILFIK